MKSTVVNILVAFSIVATGASDAAAQAVETVAWEPHAFEVRGVGRVEAEAGRLRVPERRGSPEGRTIEIGFVRLAAKQARRPPVVYLDGGPGGDGHSIARVPAFYRLFDRLRSERDVILLSQRGVGLSRPRLSCPGPNGVPDDLFLSAETMSAALEAPLVACAARFRGEGVDLGAYNTRESADDVDDLRRALGTPTIALLGFSYGTHLALEVLRRHPAGVERAVLLGTEGPWHTLKLPSGQDAQLARLAAAARDVVPDLEGKWRALLAKAAASPLELPVEVGRRSRTLRLGPEGLQWILRRDLGDTNDWPWIPVTIAAALEGNLEGLARVVPRRFQALDSGIGLMAHAMDCASGVPADRLAAIRREAPGSALGRMTNYPYPDVCDVLELPALDDDFRAPFASAVPTLFISGVNDGNTQPSQADEVAARFSRATQLVVADAGHESTMPDAAVQDAIARYLAGESVEGLRLRVPLAPFIPMPR